MLKRNRRMCHIWKCNTNTYSIGYSIFSSKKPPNPIHECEWRQKRKEKVRSYSDLTYKLSYSVNDAKDCTLQSAHCAFYFLFRTSRGFGKSFFCAFTFYDFLIPKTNGLRGRPRILQKLVFLASKLWSEIDDMSLLRSIFYQVTQCVSLCISKTF